MEMSTFCTLACTLKQRIMESAQQGCSCVYSHGYLPVTFSETSCLIFKTKSDILLMSCFKLSIFFFFLLLSLLCENRKLWLCLCPDSFLVVSFTESLLKEPHLLCAYSTVPETEKAWNKHTYTE